MHGRKFFCASNGSPKGNKSLQLFNSFMNAKIGIKKFDRKCEKSSLDFVCFFLLIRGGIIKPQMHLKKDNG